MLLQRIAIENTRSFLDRTELVLDGNISILIGPNGGGKTNLLDVIVIMLRRYLFASMYAVHSPTTNWQNRYQFQQNDVLNNMSLEPHNQAQSKPQRVEIEVEVTDRDVANIKSIKADALKLVEISKT